METTQPRSFAIVVGFEFNDAGAFAFAQAARLAKQIPSATLHLVHVCETKIVDGRAVSLRQHLELYAQDQASAVGLEGRAVGLHLRDGEPAEAIVKLAREIDADLIVVGSSEHMHAPWSPASTVEGVMAKASCPVLIAGPKPPPRPKEEATIEPPCPDCVTTRRESAGDAWWCARHSRHAAAPHTLSYRREFPFATRDSQLGPTGV